MYPLATTGHSVGQIAAYTYPSAGTIAGTDYVKPQVNHAKAAEGM
jgi:hypothetical protein